MPQLWFPPTSAGSAWRPSLLAGDCAVLTGRPDEPLVPDAAFSPAAHPAGLVRVRSGSATGWALLVGSSSGVLVNGEPVRLGMRLLRDRDEVLVPGVGRTYFSTERLAVVEPFPGLDGRTPICPRCRQELERGRPAVQCPSAECGAWHHEDAERELLCWSYDSHCALCPQPTALDAGYGFNPEEL